MRVLIASVLGIADVEEAGSMEERCVSCGYEPEERSPQDYTIGGQTYRICSYCALLLEDG